MSRYVEAALPSLDDSFETLSYHAKTIWLFTRSDLKTIVIPSTFFGLLAAYSGPPLMTSTLTLSSILLRTPYVLLWVWSTLLPFNINNQCHPDSIAEDRFNKPWRPMPGNRIAPKHAITLMCILYVVNLAIGFQLGAVRQSVALLLLGIWYNRLGGADRSCMEKNFINGAGYVSFITGALSVAANTPRTLVTTAAIAVPWFTIIGATIFTTVHMQDLEDQEGDAARGRWTVPLVLGDAVARYIIAVAVPAWSVFTPFFMKSRVSGFVLPNLLAAVVAFRVLRYRYKEEDRATFIIWNMWILSIYAIPLSVVVS
ncbi:UbiA prenyltransferase family [Massariosphaeria phaeospora]|uniref:UbiA prenyltransferase family n=1 Tax=Massariosphaeria phaeospora TaxID=100035 RepID=A0A7C8M929_9PLEO|nr:UbiA prenyltransferase family [Massariosphaeria phaeospora]